MQNITRQTREAIDLLNTKLEKFWEAESLLRVPETATTEVGDIYYQSLAPAIDEAGTRPAFPYVLSLFLRLQDVEPSGTIDFPFVSKVYDARSFKWRTWGETQPTTDELIEYATTAYDSEKAADLEDFHRSFAELED